MTVRRLLREREEEREKYSADMTYDQGGGGRGGRGGVGDEESFDKPLFLSGFFPPNGMGDVVVAAVMSGNFDLGDGATFPIKAPSTPRRPPRLAYLTRPPPPLHTD